MYCGGPRCVAGGVGVCNVLIAATRLSCAQRGSLRAMQAHMRRRGCCRQGRAARRGHGGRHDRAARRWRSAVGCASPRSGEMRWTKLHDAGTTP
eukprot:357859-Chlamydomonas_euryale.AAC.4